MPLPHRAWYQCILTVIPSPSPQASITSQQWKCPAAPYRYATALCQSIPQQTLQQCRVPVIDTTSFFRIPQSWMTCECAVQMSHPLLSNSVGHLVIRHLWQWEVIVGTPFAHMLGANARNRVWHSAKLWEAWKLLKSQLHEFLFAILDSDSDVVVQHAVFKDS